jgi:hypothetical protein
MSEIDGPGRGNRNKIVDLISSGKLKLDTDVHILIDDVERKDGFNLSINMSELLKRECKLVEYPLRENEKETHAFSHIESKENTK